MSITIGSGITLGAGISLNPPSPSLPWTWDPAYVGGNITLTNADLVVVAESNLVSEPSVLGTWPIPAGSKVMFSVCALAVTTSDVSGIGVGSRAMNVNDFIGVDFATSQGVYEDGGNYTQTQTPTMTGLTYTNLNTIDVAVDRVNNLFWYRQGFSGAMSDWNNDPTADPATATGGYTISDLVGTVYPAAGPYYVMAQNPPTGAFGANSESGGAVPNGFTFAAAVAPTWTWNQLGSGLQTVFSGRTVSDFAPGTYTALGSYAIADTARVMYTVTLDWDADMVLTQNQAVGYGLASTNLEAGLGADQHSMGVLNTGEVYFGGTVYAAGSTTFGQGDVIDLALTGSYMAGGWWYRVNGGAWNGDPTADPAANIGGYPQIVNDTGLPLYPGVSIAGTTGPSVFTMQEAPIYPKPAGFTFLGSSQI